MVLSGSYINKINKVSALRSSAGAVHVGHPYGTYERDSNCTTTVTVRVCGMHNNMSYKVFNDGCFSISSNSNTAKLTEISNIARSAHAVHQCHKALGLSLSFSLLRLSKIVRKQAHKAR